MPDSSDEQKKSIPAWQTTTQDSPKPSTPHSPERGDNAEPPQSDLIDHAARFLDDEAIRDASRERKVAFLEKKGLQADEIQQLLGSPSDSQSSTSDEEKTDMKTVHDSNATSQQSASNLNSTTPSQIPAAAQINRTSNASPNRELPPIITYPEFLLQPTQPPPLITFQRLSYALYTIAGLSALTYGTGKYLVQPMLASLTSARHELAHGAVQNLEKLNTKLEENVSQVPVMSSSTLLKRWKQNEDDHSTSDDVESIDSDPTELYHRDVATQTSPSLARSPSQSSSSSYLLHNNQSKSRTEDQSNRLTSLRTSLASLLDSETTATTTSETVKAVVSDLQSDLDNIEFRHSAYLDYSDPYGADPRRSAGGGSGPGGSKKTSDGDEDEFAKFKAEIRSVKGALLSSRNFPTGRPASGAGLAVR